MLKRLKRDDGFISIIGIIVLVLAIVGLMALCGDDAHAVTEHCPDGGTKTEAQGDELNDVVLEAGTEACVKGSTDAVSFTADGQTTLAEYLGNGHDVSYYVVYSTPTPTPTPTPTDSPSPSPTPPDRPDKPDRPDRPDRPDVPTRGPDRGLAFTGPADVAVWAAAALLSLLLGALAWYGGRRRQA
jgi:hypothetical protein